MKAVIKENLKPGICIRELDPPAAQKDPIVRIEAAALCGSDLHMFEDMSSYQFAVTPVIMGHEACGVIEYSGDSGLMAGQRVVIDSVLSCGECFYCRTGRENLCVNRKTVGQQIDGVFARYARLPKRVLIPVPNHLPAEQGACLEPFGVALRCIEQAGICPGDTVAIIGPGPIGLMAMLLARHSGAATVIMVGTPADEMRLNLARQLGADAVICSPEELKQHRNQYSVVLEWSGSQGGFLSACELVAAGGTIVVGAIYSREAHVDMNTLVRREITLKTARSRTYSTWKRAIDLVCKQVVDLGPIVTHRYPVEAAQEAFEQALARKSIKTVLTF